MASNPQDDGYPEGIYQDFSLNFQFLGDDKYKLSCEKWKFEIYTKNPMREAAILLNEILDHNDEIIREEGRL